MSSEFKFRALTSEDWKEINEGNLIYDKDGLNIKDTERDGVYTSGMLDSGISGCFWHRIVLDADIPENSTITVSFITSETEEAESSSGCCNIVFTKAKDALIQTLHGRYIRLIIEFHREGEKSPVLRQVKVYYERISYLRYLPAIYQENNESKEFLERFLSIFESSMYDSEETISSIPVFFDPMAAPEDFYRWLADWLSLDLYDLLEEDKKREFILKAVEFYRKKGTVSGLSDLVTVLTGKKCCIKEYKNNVFRSWGMEHVEMSELDDDGKLDILQCETESDKDKLEGPECTKFYRRMSRTVTDSGKVPGLLANRGKYCDEMHYVTGETVQKSKNEPPIRYFSNSIGIFVFFPFGEELLIKSKQLSKIIDSFLPVFVTANITYVETSLKEYYQLNWIQEEYYDEVIAPLEEDKNIQYVQGEYTNEIEGWTRFYTYYGADRPNHPTYGRTFSKDHLNYRNFRTVHRSVGFKLSL